MSFYEHEVFTTASFKERIGEPEEFDAALGKIVESFSYLEQSLCNVITILLGVPNEIGEIITSELSYKGLLNLFSSLFIHKNLRGDFCVESEDIEARFKELMSLCNSSEEHRNRIIHSSYVYRRYRVKKTAKAKTGLRTVVEEIDSGRLLDIADLISYTGMQVEEFPSWLNITDEISGDGRAVQYFKNGRVIHAFGHDVPN